MASEERAELERRIAGVPIWYHTLELAPGVLTPGYFDMRPFVGEFGFPTSMAGLRVVDVGASNGQFAFHFEGLGAEHVVAIDLAHVLDHDLPHWYEQELRARWNRALQCEHLARNQTHAYRLRLPDGLRVQ